MSRFFSHKKITSAGLGLFLLTLVFLPNVTEAAGIAETAGNVLVGILWAFVSNVFGFFVWMTGGLLDMSINLFVVQFGELFRTSGLGAAVNNLWMVVRDVFNLLFIFGLIYAGFNLIINSDEGGVRKTIVNLIIAALLINFSLFITKTIIDFGNIAAVQVAHVLRSGGNDSISGAFLQTMGAATIWGPGGAMAMFREPPSFVYVIGAMLLFMVAAFSFAAGAVLICIRFIMLNYYMVISPVMFLGKIVPKFSSYSSNFWKDLFANVFFAPAFLLLLYFSLYILDAMSGYLTGLGAGPRSLYQAFGSPAAPQTALTTIMMFFMAAGFLLASVVLAKKMGAVGGEMAVSVGHSVRKGATRATTGWSTRLLNKGATKLGRRLDGGLAKLGQSNSKMLRATARGLDNSVGATVRSAQNLSIAGSETYAQREKRIREHQSRFNKNAQTGTRATDFARYMADYTNNADTTDATQRAARSAALNDLARVVGRMSDDEILDLDPSMLSNPEFAQLLTDAHMTALKNSGKYTNAQTTAMGKARDTGTFNTLTQVLDGTNTEVTELNSALGQLTQTVQRISGDRLTGLDHGILSSQRVAMNLTDKQIDDLRASGKFNAQQITAIENARAAAFTAVASGVAPDLIAAGNPNGAGVIDSMRAGLFQKSAQDAGRLPAAVFADVNMQPFITPTALQQRVRNGLSKAETTAIEDNLNDYLTRPGTDQRTITMWRRWANNTTEGSRFDFGV